MMTSKLSPITKIVFKKYSPFKITSVHYSMPPIYNTHKLLNSTLPNSVLLSRPKSSHPKINKSLYLAIMTHNNTLISDPPNAKKTLFMMTLLIWPN